MHSFLKLAVAKTHPLRPVVCLLFVLALPWPLRLKLV